MPASWAAKLFGHWRDRYGADPVRANLDLAAHARKIASAQRAGVPADATDNDLCMIAMETAREAARRIHEADAYARAMLGAGAERLNMLGRCLAALDFAEGLGLADHFRACAARGIEGALRRVACDRWWRRVLRKLHARAVEATARALGLVHKLAGCYVSNDGFKRRRHQRARNAATLESMSAINDDGQVYSLAELAAVGPSNPVIRRHELMTRVAGFEVIAKELGHAAYFATVTCPSRMHAMRTRRSGAVEPNPAFDGTTPDDAQRYLSAQWARFRAAAERAGVELYGFRIAEPNHDATPHWHMLVFFPRQARPRVVRTGRACWHPPQRWPCGPMAAIDTPAARAFVRLLRRYFLLNDSPDEPGARKHRVKVERIDWSRGSAAGYIAKYVAKNIDGMHVERDLYGNPAMESSLRVEAWATTWRIRQFQQIGGAPVTIWRELRRLNELQGDDSTPLVAMAIDAANTTTERTVDPFAQQDLTTWQGLPPGTLMLDKPAPQFAEPEADERANAADGWCTYLHLQGGSRVRRDALRVRVLRECTGETGRYGETMLARPVGVVVDAVERFELPPLGIVLHPWTHTRQVRSEVESERHLWVIVPRSQRVEVTRNDAGEVVSMWRPMHPGAAGVLRALHARRTPRPWSSVDNCTASPIAGTARRRVRKRGFATDWRKRRRPPTADPPADRAPVSHI